MNVFRQKQGLNKVYKSILKSFARLGSQWSKVKGGYFSEQYYFTGILLYNYLHNTIILF